MACHVLLVSGTVEPVRSESCRQDGERSSPDPGDSPDRGNAAGQFLETSFMTDRSTGDEQQWSLATNWEIPTTSPCPGIAHVTNRPCSAPAAARRAWGGCWPAEEPNVVVGRAVSSSSSAVRRQYRSAHRRCGVADQERDHVD